MRTKTLLIAVLMIFPALAAADGIIIPEPPYPGFPNIVYHNVSINISNQVGQTSVDQVFENHLGYELVGKYVFPLPTGAAISDFALWVDGERYSGEVLDSEKAKELFIQAAREKKNTGLLEYVGQDLFQYSVNIPQNQQRRIQISYSEILSCDSGLCKYVYPLATEKHSANPLKKCKISIQLSSDTPIETIYSPSHQIQIQRTSPNQATILWEENESLPDKDFVLYYSTSEKELAANIVSDGQHFLLLVAPNLEKILDQDVVEKNIAFVIDTSGSMSGEKLAQAKEGLKYCLSRLNPKDTFNIIEFNNQIHYFSDKPVGIEKTEQATQYIDALQATGGTNINDALQTALSILGQTEKQPTIIFLTDGLPTSGTTDADTIVSNTEKNNQKNAKIFAFGVGYDVNTHLLDKLSQENHGATTYVEPAENIEQKITTFFDKINSPVLVNPRIVFENIKASETYPRQTPDIFKGSQVELLGKYTGCGQAKLNIIGETSQGEKTFEYDVEFECGDKKLSFLPRLWATRKIGHLLDTIRLEGPSQQLLEELQNLSLKYGIVTPYTSIFIEKVGEETPSQDPYEAADWMLRTLAETTGAGAVASAKNIQDTYHAAQTSQAQEEVQTATGQQLVVKHILDKTFVNKQGKWIDTEYAQQETQKIAYDTQQYYDFISQNAESAPYLAAGNKTILIIGTKAYEIVETQQEAQEPQKDFYTSIIEYIKKLFAFFLR